VYQKLNWLMVMVEHMPMFVSHKQPPARQSVIVRHNHGQQSRATITGNNHRQQSPATITGNNSIEVYQKMSWLMVMVMPMPMFVSHKHPPAQS